jgi:hypothetical protein
MMWGLARYAARLARSLSARPARDASASNTGARGLVEITAPKSKAHGLSTSALWRRGLNLNNRDKAKALQYVLRHQSLSKGRFSDDT